MSRRQPSSRRHHRTWWAWLLLAAVEVLVGAYLGDTYGWGPIVVTVVIVVLVSAFHRSRQHTRRRVRH